MTDGEQGKAPDPVRLADWLKGRHDPVAAAQAAEHRKRGLGNLTQWVRTLVESADTSALPAPPPLVRQRLRQSYSDWWDGREGRSPASAPAVLAFDSRVDRASTAVRGGADHTAIHLAYRADLADLVLDIRMLGRGSARVDGQVFPFAPTDAPVFEVVATGSAAVIRVVDGDMLGRFHMAPVPLDLYDLAISNGEFTMTAPLDLRAH